MKEGAHLAPLVERVALPQKRITEPMPVARAAILRQRRLVLRDLIFDGGGRIIAERNVRPRVAAAVHARIDPDVQGLPRIGIIFELDRIYKTVRPFETIRLEL